MNNIKFSVVVPLYNKEDQISETIQSVLDQEFSDFEVIVVDDGSTDGSAAIVEDFVEVDARIKLIRQENGHVSRARNRGIEASSGQVVAFLDADDVWRSDHLIELNHLVESYPEAGLLGTAYVGCYGSGRSVSFVVKEFSGKNGLIRNYFKLTSEAQFIYTSSIAIPRWALEQEQGFNEEDRKFAEDLDMWFRFAIRWPVAYSGKPSVYYNCDVPGQATGSGAVTRGLSTGFISRVIDFVNTGKNSHCVKVSDVSDYQQYKVSVLLGKYLMDRAFTTALYSDFIRESGIGSAQLNWRNRLLIRLPCPLLWRPYYFIKRFLTSRKYIELHSGRFERRGILYSFYDESCD